MKKETTKYLDGGKVKGPGTETSDSIPARLSDGEFVVKAKVVKQPGVLEFLKALNDEKLKPVKMNEGGLLDTAKQFAQFIMTPGKVEQVKTEPGTKLYNPMGTKTVNTVPLPSNYPDTSEKIGPASAPVPGINSKVLEQRLADIQKEQNELKKAQMKKMLIEQIQNLQLNPEQEQQAIGAVGFKDGGEVKMDESLFDETPYEAPKEMDESLFEEAPERTIASEVEAQKAPAVDVTPARSGLIGAAQSASLGFGEELTAPFMAAAAMTKGAINPEDAVPSLPGEGPIDKLSRLSSEYIDMAREEQKAAEEQNPGSYTLGQVAGGLASPGLGAVKALKAVKNVPGALGVAAKTAVGAATGAGLGGVAGLGEAEGSLEERLPEAANAVKTGAVVGGAIPVAGGLAQGAGKLLAKGAEGIGAKPVIDALKAGLEGVNIVTKKGQAEAVSLGKEKAQELYKDTRKLLKQVGSKIGQEIKDAEAEGKTLDLSDDVKNAFNKLNEIKEKGSTEAASAASSVEAEIKKVLGIKPKAVDEGFMGVAKEALPEGLIVPKPVEQNVDELLKQVNPTKAKELKNILTEQFLPTKQMDQSKVGAYGAAKSLAGRTESINKLTGEVTPASGIAGKLQDVTENLPELNKQYSDLLNALKGIAGKENVLPTKLRNKINKLLVSSESKGLAATDSADLINDLKTAIQNVSPEVAQKYGTELQDVVQKVQLADELNRSFVLNPKALGMRAANIAGLAGSGPAKLVSKNMENIKKTAVLNPDIREAGGEMSKSFGNDLGIKPKEHFEYQKDVVKAIENVEPEILTGQAQKIRDQYAEKGEQLATILDNMSKQNKDSRRALMFSVMQNPAYRQMLGLKKGDNDE